MGNLAIVFTAQGRLEAARDLGTQALEALTTSVGWEHPATLVIAFNLVDTYFLLGRLSEALALLERYVQGCRQVYGEEHLVTRDGLRILSELSEL
jgi:hypothetical protein